jgi:hypothetical protein
MPGFAGTCAPFFYVDQCPTKERDIYVLVARIWVGPNALAFIALLISFIRRVKVVDERFNTLRLLMVKFMIGIPLQVTFDLLRALSPKAFGAPLHFVNFLWVMQWVPVISGMVLLITTWISFSSKSLLSRPVVTGNWVLYLGIMLPYAISSLILAVISGISHKVYSIGMRILLASWAAMFFLLFIICVWYGRQTIKRLSAAGDKFTRDQQFRAMFVVCFILFGCGALMTVQAVLMLAIDKSPTWFLIITQSYRICALLLYVTGAIYSWVATNRWMSQSHPSTGRSGTGAHPSQNGPTATPLPITGSPSQNSQRLTRAHGTSSSAETDSQDKQPSSAGQSSSESTESSDEGSDSSNV